MPSYAAWRAAHADARRHVPRDAAAVRATIFMKRGTIHVPRGAAAVRAAIDMKRGTIHVPCNAAVVSAAVGSRRVMHSISRVK
jgi:formylmethanofuran dehydrogenase subunit C